MQGHSFREAGIYNEQIPYFIHISKALISIAPSNKTGPKNKQL